MVKVKWVVVIGLCIIMSYGITSSIAQAEVAVTPVEVEAIAVDAVDTDEVGTVTDVTLKEDETTVQAVEFTKDDIETDVKIDAETGEMEETAEEIEEDAVEEK